MLPSLRALHFVLHGSSKSKKQQLIFLSSFQKSPALLFFSCQKPVLMGVLNEARSLKNILLLSVSDHFELCLAKCRTSSRSVQHENIYINPQNKFCYTKEQSSKAGDKP